MEMEDVLLHVTCLRRNGYQTVPGRHPGGLRDQKRDRGYQTSGITSDGHVDCGVHPSQLPPVGRHVQVKPSKRT